MVLEATPTTIDFEGLPDSTILTTQYPGLTFTNVIVLTAGISLNEFEFPPHSGTNVVSDNGGPITIDFSTPITSFGGYFTYLEPLTLEGFNGANTEVASASSAYSTNDALYGDPGSSPNELIQLSFTGGISSITIIGDPAGGSFVLDDATYNPANTSVPESDTLRMFILSAASLLIFRRIYNTGCESLTARLIKTIATTKHEYSRLDLDSHNNCPAANRNSSHMVRRVAQESNTV